MKTYESFNENEKVKVTASEIFEKNSKRFFRYGYL